MGHTAWISGRLLGNYRIAPAGFLVFQMGDVWLLPSPIVSPALLLTLPISNAKKQSRQDDEDAEKSLLSAYCNRRTSSHTTVASA